MLPRPFNDQRFMQICWVVPDLREAMANWTRTAGVGPFFYFERVLFENGVYRGRPAQLPRVEAAIAQAGEMQIELVAQLEDAPSAFSDLIPFGQGGLHHLALYCEDYDDALAQYTAGGAEVAFAGLMMGARTCWIDTSASLGFMLELIEANPVAEQVFGAFRAAAANWDGRDPVRTL